MTGPRGMSEVIAYVRGMGHTVLLDEAEGRYHVHAHGRAECYLVDAYGLVRFANLSRFERGDPAFDLDVAWPLRRRRRRHPGSLMVLVSP